MRQMKCPDCGAQTFYVKDPDDRFTISEFSLQGGTIEYTGDEPEEERIPVRDESEIFCDRCAWHDRLRVIKPIN